jgi:hypothetical protein
VVFDGEKEIQSIQSRTVVWDGKIAVSGEPDEFAEELCKVLFDAWGLRSRRDLLDLLPQVAVQLTRIGNAQIVEAWLSRVSSPISQEPAGGEKREQEPANEKSTQPNMHDETGNGARASRSASSEESRERTESESKSTTQPAGEQPGTTGRGHTASDREVQISSWIKQKKDL